MDRQTSCQKKNEKFVLPAANLELSTKVEDNINDKKGQVTWRDVYPQILCSLMSFLFNLHVGIYLVYTNLFLQYLDTNIASCIVSLGAMATAIGVAISGPIADKFGRRSAHIIMSIPCIASWFIFAVSDITQVYLLLIARLLGGLTTGLTIASLIYVTEIAHKDFRAMLLSLLGVYGGFGTLLISVLASFLNWRWAACVFTCIFIIVIISITLYIPETPFWLLNFGGNKVLKARENLDKLNPNKVIANGEWLILTQNHEKKLQSDANKISWKFSDPTIYKPIGLLLCLLFLQQMTGSFVVLYYVKTIIPLISPEIFEKFDKEVFIMFGATRFVSNIVGCISAKRVGRRSLLMFSACSMAFSSFVLATLLTNVFNFEYREELSIILFLWYVFATGIGVLIIPWTISPELLPPLLKGIGSSFMIGYSYLVSSFFSQPLPYIMNESGMPYVFLLFGVFCIFITVFTYFFVPETLGKNIHEINEIFRKKKTPTPIKLPNREIG